MKKIVSVTLFTAILTLIRMIAGFIVAKVVAIYTGPSGIAMLGQLQSMATSFTGLMNAPVGNAVVRYTSENSAAGYGACATWWKASTKWLMIFSLILIPIICIFSLPLSNWLFQSSDYYFIIILLALLLPISALGTFISSILNGLGNYRRYISLGIISVILSSCIMLILVKNYGMMGALVAGALQSSLIGLVLLVFSIRQPWLKFKYFFGKVEKEKKKAIAGYILMALTTALTVPLSLIMIRKILVSHVGWDLTGQWQAVWRISETYLAVITMALGTYYLPKLSAIKDNKEIKYQVYSIAKIFIPVSVCLACGVYFCRDIIISLVFTHQFFYARELFLIQLIGDVIKIASWIFAYPMLSRGAVKWYVFSEIIFSTSFVIFAWIFVSFYGVHGANIAYALNYLIYFIVMFRYLPVFSR